MANKKLGRLVLIQIGLGEATETFTNLCGLNSKSFTINNTSIDVTTPDDTAPGGPVWTESLAGVKNMSLSGDGFFGDTVSENRVNAVAMSADPKVNLKVTVPDLGTYTGSFRLTTLDFGGETEGGTTYSISLESNGVIAYAAAT